jgi:Domain of unknown function (DUF4265)
MGEDKEALEHVILDVSDSTFGTRGERVWALPLGADLYEIRNTPWHTCEVNWGDVVRAIAESEDHWPTMVEVVRRSGHRTLHIFFFKETTEIEKQGVLSRLTQWKASYENAQDRLYAVDVEPDGDFEGLCDLLGAPEMQKILDYRTRVD